MDEFARPDALRDQTARQLLDFIQTEIEVSKTFVRLAHSELRGGDIGHADELIAKARVGYETALKFLSQVPAEFEAEKQKLPDEARDLDDSIGELESERRKLNHSNK